MLRLSVEGQANNMMIKIFQMEVSQNERDGGKNL